MFELYAQPPRISCSFFMCMWDVGNSMAILVLAPYVLFFVIREVIKYLSSLIFLPIYGISYVRL